MSKHTPGPWGIYIPEEGQDGYPHNWNIGHDSETRSVYVASVIGAVHFERARADARLIAAVPTMLDELQSILETLRYGWGVKASDVACRIERLIEEATGEAP